MSATLAVYASLDVNLSAIKLPKNFNLRSETDAEDEKKLDDLGASIKADGLITPLLVRTTKKGEYELVGGFRRYMAMKKANLRGTVPVRCRDFVSAADAVLTNMTENTAREDVHSADLAKRLYELDSGTYPGGEVNDDGRGLSPVPRETICARTGLSLGYVGNLIRAWKNLSDKIRLEWRRKDVPTDVVVRLGKLKTEEEQVAAFEAWKDEVARAAERKAAAKIKGLAKTNGRGEEGEEGEEGELPPSEGPKGKKVIAKQLAKFQERFEKEKLSPRDCDVAEAKINTLRWVLGELNRLTFT